MLIMKSGLDLLRRLCMVGLHVIGLWRDGYWAYTQCWWWSVFGTDRCSCSRRCSDWLTSWGLKAWCCCHRCCTGATYSSLSVVLEKPIPHLGCRQEDWEFVRGDVNCFNWNEFIRSTCPVSSLNKALLHVIRDRIPNRQFSFRRGDKPWFDDRGVLVHRAKQRGGHIEREVLVGRRLIENSTLWLDAMLSLSMLMLNKRNSWRIHQMQGSGGPLLEQRSLVLL